MATQLATKEQKKLARRGIGRITKTGRYQSEKEIQRRKIQELRRQLNREIPKLQEQYNKLSGSVSQERAAKIQESIDFYTRQYERVTTLLPKEKKYSKNAPKEFTNKKHKEYLNKLNELTSEVGQSVNILKTRNINIITNQKSRYEMHKKAIWKQIYIYTYGDKKEGGLWTGSDKTHDRRTAIYEYVAKNYPHEGKLTEKDVFDYFNTLFKKESGDEDFDIISYILRAGDDYKYDVIHKGGITELYGR